MGAAWTVCLPGTLQLGQCGERQVLRVDGRDQHPLGVDIMKGVEEQALPKRSRRVSA